jgi:monovalent cation/hydrogen antiporter
VRGVISVAAALALPLSTESEAPFPERDLILFLTFCVIMAMLVV